MTTPKEKDLEFENESEFYDFRDDLEKNSVKFVKKQKKKKNENAMIVLLKSNDRFRFVCR